MGKKRNRNRRKSSAPPCPSPAQSPPRAAPAQSPPSVRGSPHPAPSDSLPLARPVSTPSRGCAAAPTAGTPRPRPSPLPLSLPVYSPRPPPLSPQCSPPATPPRRGGATGAHAAVGGLSPSPYPSPTPTPSKRPQRVAAAPVPMQALCDIMGVGERPALPGANVDVTVDVNGGEGHDSCDDSTGPTCSPLATLVDCSPVGSSPLSKKGAQQSPSSMTTDDKNQVEHKSLHFKSPRRLHSSPLPHKPRIKLEFHCTRSPTATRPTESLQLISTPPRCITPPSAICSSPSISTGAREYTPRTMQRIPETAVPSPDILSCKKRLFDPVVCAGVPLKNKPSESLKTSKSPRDVDKHTGEQPPSGSESTPAAQQTSNLPKAHSDVDTTTPEKNEKTRKRKPLHKTSVTATATDDCEPHQAQPAPKRPRLVFSESPAKPIPSREVKNSEEVINAEQLKPLGARTKKIPGKGAPIFHPTSNL
ncbi:hypothetical protein Pelo_3200 [Pelomyxa schiedti]|nr:hypothetical protein Pelo_3200 [Pelomyxa schiedti]